jgi:hypothetical protein
MKKKKEKRKKKNELKAVVSNGMLYALSSMEGLEEIQAASTFL